MNHGEQLPPEFAPLANLRTHRGREFYPGSRAKIKLPIFIVSKLRLNPFPQSIIPSILLRRWFGSLWATIAIIGVIFGLLAEGNMTLEDRAELSTRPGGHRVLWAVWKVRKTGIITGYIL